MRRARPLLGTIVDIRIDGDGAHAERAVAAAFGAVERVHRLMSAHDPASDVSRLNRALSDAVIDIDPWTQRVIAHAQDIGSATFGLFDCGVAPLLQDAGYLPRFAATAARDAGNQDDIEFPALGKARLRRPVQITLDGIAKGFAVDRAVEALQAADIGAGIVNAGGDLRVFGAQAEAIHARDPVHPGQCVLIGHMREGAVATSAAYFSRDVRNGRAVSHIFNPHSGAPFVNETSVSIIARDCMTADALTKAMLLDPDRIEPRLARFGARAVVLGSMRSAA